uniref:hypothetical protein n=1 Tax=uncultured Caulobacter sp. TaxID=158749 RepID=UPI0025E19574|nr:hypothetical protein [uncultured Caulobacter sp.]
METRPFDPAEYLDSEEAIAAYLADARSGDAEEIAHAAKIADRARALIDARRSHMPKRA